MSPRGRREPEQFSRYGAHEGVCQGCGKPIYYRRRGRDTFQWHRRCYQRLYRRKKRGSLVPLQKTCAVCGKIFVAAGQGAAMKKTCSKACATDLVNLRRYQGVKFSRLHPEGVCLGCGGRTFKRRRRRGRRNSFNWHGQCYTRVRELPDPVRLKLISIHREFAEWLSAWKKRIKPGARSAEGRE